MAATQARTERQISELLRRPGNDVCADCSSPSPRWCSWNLGIFLCVACASVHRKMGSHISRVKSLTLDTFTRDQIDALSKGGNLSGNALRNNDDRANPPPTNLEMEGRDNELERYIRKKYMSPRPLPDSTSLLSGRQPPQLPPTLQATRDHIPLRRSPTPGGSLSTSATPVFGRVLEHRPTKMSDASTGGTSAMRRGRPTPSSSSSSTGLVNTFSPPSHAPPPPPRATIQQQQVQQQSSTASAGGYNPSMGFAVSLQQQQQKQQPASTPPHGPWSDLLSLSQSQPQPPQHAPIPQLQQQQASSSLAPALAPFPNLQQQQSFTGMSVAGGQPAVYDQSPAAYGLASQQFVQQQQQPMPSQSIFGQQRQAPPMGMYGQQPQLSPYHTQPQLLQQQSFSQSQPALYGQPQQAGPVGNGGAVSFMQGMMPTRQLGVQFPPQQQQQQQYGGGPYGPGGW